MAVLSSTSGVKISFYVNPKHRFFKDFLKDEIRKMEERNIWYFVFEDRDMLSPQMCCNGDSVIGLDDIKTELKMVLTR